MENVKSHNIVFLDDDFEIRYLVKIALAKLEKTLKEKIDIYTSDNGVEGLGYIFVTNPEVIIIDTTLPKYSGKELIEFLVSNPKFNSALTKIILLHEDELSPEFFASGYAGQIVLSKKDPKFFDKLIFAIEEGLKFRHTFMGFDHLRLKTSRVVKKVCDLTLKFANKRDLLNEKYYASKNKLEKLMLWPVWVYYEISLSLLLTFLKLFLGVKEDANIVESKETDELFRSHHYRTFATFLTTLLISVVQIGLFLSGGVTILILNREFSIQSALADYSKIVSIDLNKATFDRSEIVYGGGSLKLKELETSEENEPSERLEEVKQDDIKQEAEQKVEKETKEEVETLEQSEDKINNDIPQSEVKEKDEIETKQPVSAPSVLGIDVNNNSKYPVNHPEVRIVEGVKFTKLIDLKEISSINSPESSNDEPKDSQNRLLTYQLSPNGQDWFYLNSSNKWEKTLNSWTSSNTIQEINKYLGEYTKHVNDTGTLFIKIFFNSDGNKQIELKDLIVERVIETITMIEKKEEEESEPEVIKIEEGDLPGSYPVSYTPEKMPVSGPKIPRPVNPAEVLSYPISYTTNLKEVSEIKLLKPVILNAAYVNGKKVISGRVEGENHEVIEIASSLLVNYKVKIYYENGQYIGETVLQEIQKFGHKQYVFELKVPAKDGGYVYAVLEYKQGEKGLLIDKSTKLENSTFTVNETGDQADASAGDGSCDYDGITPGSQCTLRAAIEEGNALVGGDNIHFNIPTLDPGYRDNDDPNTPSSGDSNGDDYWTIRPATNLPDITEETDIDGETQGMNQTQTNGTHPEIEINGVLVAGGDVGLRFAAGSTNSSVNNLVINDFNNSTNSYGIQLSSTSNFVLTKSYIGTNVRGDTRIANRTGVYVLSSTNINIGTSTSDGNVISGNASANMVLTCPVLSGYPAITVRGNLIGLNATGDQKLGVPTTPYGIHFEQQCNAEIGGPNSNHRNYIAGVSYGIYLQLIAADVQVGIYNNFFSTDTTGTQLISNYEDISDYSSDFIGGVNKIDIGGPNKGNIFRGDYGIDVNSTRNHDVTYNVFTNKWAGIWNVINPTNIKYNFFSMGPDSDPYFNISYNGQVVTGNDYNYGLFDIGATSIIQGNIFTDMNIGMQVNSNQANDLNNANDIISFATIGGPGNDANSLCKVSGIGKEANCFKNIYSNYYTAAGDVAGVLLIDAIAYNQVNRSNPTNYIFEPQRIYTQNVWGSNVQVAALTMWEGTYEIFSGTTARTDLAGSGITVPLPDNTMTGWTGNTTATIYDVSCSSPTPITCIGGRDAVANYRGVTPNMNQPWSWSYPLTYIIDGSGNYEWLADYKFDLPHFASKKFSFDGDAFTDPQTTSERGEKWIIKPVSDNGTPANNTDDLGTVVNATYTENQIMEVEYVDANPIKQNDGSFVIYVDSTTDEDNVSSSGYDDGDGIYSGGGNNGPSGLPNGKTSLREAVIVANNHPGNDKIEFRIPTTDPNWNTISFPNQFVININTLFPDITGSGTKILGTTQEQFTGNNNLPVDEPTNLPVVGSASTGPEIIINGQSLSNAWVRVFAGDVEISGLGIYNFNQTISGNRRVIESHAGGSDLDIVNNTFVNNGGGIYTNRAAVSDIVFASNVVKQTKDGGRDALEIQFFPVTNFVIEENQFVDNNAGAIAFSNQTSTGQIQISDNLFKGNNTNTTESKSEVYTFGTNSTPIIITNNRFVGSAGAALMIKGATTKVTMQDNLITSNVSIGIDISDADNNQILPGDGIDANDSQDLDVGPNDLQNYPVITKVEYLGAEKYKVYGTLDRNNTEDPFEVELCLSDGHSSNHGGCNDSLEFKTVTTNNFDITVELPGSDGTEGRLFTMLATNANGSTSEFSMNFLADDGQPNYFILEYPVTLVSPIDGVQIGDRTPKLKWSTTNPEVDHFDIYLDGQLYATVNGNVTEYDISQELAFGNHTWQIKAYREGDEATGESTTENFVIVDTTPEAEIEFDVISPKDGAIESNATPEFKWTQISGDTKDFTYQLFIDGELVQEIKGTSYTLTTEQQLNEGEHSWYVVVYIEENGELVEVTRTEEETFTIKLEPQVQPEDPDDTPVDGEIPGTDNVVTEASDLLPVTTLAPLVVATILTVWGIVSMWLVHLPGIKYVGILFGVLIPRKKKYWGVVYDLTNFDVVPFAAVRLYGMKSNSKTLISQTISDLKGRYGLLADNLAEYFELELEVQAEGYEHYVRKLDKNRLNKSYEYVEDIGLVRKSSKVNLYKRILFYGRTRLLETLNKFLLLLMVIGFVYTLVITFISPSETNLIMLAIYALLFILNLIMYLRSNKKSGKVLETNTGKGVKGASVRIYDLKGKPVDVAISNNLGDIKINVKPDTYDTAVYKSGYKLESIAKTLEGSADLIQVVVNKSGKFTKDINLKRVNDSITTMDSPFN